MGYLRRAHCVTHGNDVLSFETLVYSVTFSLPHATRETLNMHRSNKEHTNT